MKRVLLMLSVLLFPKLLVAQDFDVESLFGEEWYGLYMNGQKAGYATTDFRKDEEGRYVVSEEAKFQLNMAGIKQDMSTSTTRIYGADGGLLSIVAVIIDPAGETRFEGRVEGERLLLKTTVFGATTETDLPKPKESLDDAIKHAKWILGKPQVGDSLSFSVFEPLYKQEINGTSHILSIEERQFEGVLTKVYKVKTTLDLMNIDSVAYIAEDGTTIEDVVAGMITMRLESEEVAKDVDYANDVIISNAAMLDAPIENARTRDTLRLAIRGPLNETHVFNDERQNLRKEEDHYIFEARRVALDDFEVASLPIRNAEVLEWTKPTDLVQSDHPDLVAKARDIVGAETNTLKISEILCAWVDKNVRDTFSARLTNAREVLANLEGDCTEHSILFIGLARALGIPAREAAGLIYVGGDQPGFYFHQWAKIWVGKWIDVDPTFNQPRADVTHIKLAEGDLYNQARLIPIIGRLDIEVLPEAPASAAK